MYGTGILKGMAVTMQHFIETYLDDIRWMSRGGRYKSSEAFSVRQSLRGKGVIAVNYPEEKLPVPPRFRFVPFLVTDDPLPGQQWGHDWCTSCGICAKVCPPQCIWIVRGKLRAVNVSNGDRPRWRIPIDAIKEFESRRSAVTPSKPARRRRRRPEAVIQFYQ